MLSDENILVVGVARNCEKTIQQDVRRLHAAFQSARQLQWLIVESDSTDKTLDALIALAREIPNFRFQSLGSLAPSIPLRTVRIARCRNACLDELDSNPLYAAVDLVVVADLDGVNDLVTAEGVASCFLRSDWDVCTANQRGPYYDLWALRHPIWSPNDCWKQYRFLHQHGIQRELAFWVAMYGKMIVIPESADWIPVDSAFGGLAIYRREMFDGARYSGVDESGEPICEHVVLHRQMEANGCRILINPRMINTAATNQSYERSLLRTLRRYLLDLRHQAKMRVLGAVSRSGK
jgi:glycosyltransferase involved in cell wall biosynthesis